MSSGEMKVKAVASASGSNASTRKLALMPPLPASERPIWPNGLRVASARGNSPAELSQTTNTTSAPSERNNTISATGKRAETALISALITAKASVAAIFSTIPVVTEFMCSLGTRRDVAVSASGMTAVP